MTRMRMPVGYYAPPPGAPPTPKTAFWRGLLVGLVVSLASYGVLVWVLVWWLHVRQ